MQRHLVSSGSPWESEVGYSRAVRVGSQVFVSGTTATAPDGNVAHVDDAYGQTIYALRIIEKALEEVGATLKDVVRTRMFVTDISQWEDIGRAHGEFFRDIRPAATMVEVRKLIADEHLVEIEVDAVIA